MSNTWWINPTELDPDQRQVVESLPITGSFLVSGPPGSGKTNLLLLRAAHVLGATGDDVRVLSFTRSLTDFMESGCSQYKLNPRFVSTYHEWAYQFLQDAGRFVSHRLPFDEGRRQILAGLNAVISEHGPKKYHTLFVDEAQDYHADELHAIAHLARNVFLVADTRQSIYGGRSSIAVAEALVAKHIQLSRHYRSGQRICELADAVSYGVHGSYRMMDGCNYDEARMPSSRKVEGLPSFDDQIAYVEREIGAVRKAYPRDLVGILAPRSDQAARAADLLRQGAAAGAVRHISDDDTGFESQSKRVIVSTVHSAKGLEFRVVFLVGLEQLVAPFMVRNVLFTGITRAKTSIHLLYSGSYPTELDIALRRLGGERVSAPKFEDLFGGGSSAPSL